MKTIIQLITILLASNLTIFPQDSIDYEYISVNEIKMWIDNYGQGAQQPGNSGQGFYWPGGENAEISAIYSDGLLFCGQINGGVFGSGNYYIRGLQPGNILPNGEPANHNDPLFKIWKINKNWKQLPPGEKYNEYEYDYNNWPVDLGAPWKDLNGDGVFTRGTDEPDFIGDEVLFYVVNDLNPKLTQNLWGTNPAGLELQVTVYAFNSPGSLSNTVFKKYRIINKSGSSLDSMYLAYWADVDMGKSNDDAGGCDTILNLGYCYNRDNDDEGNTGYGTPPPASGHLLLQGPAVPSPGNRAFINGYWKVGYKNLGMTGFVVYICGGSDERYQCPAMGEGPAHIYNNMKGLGRNGKPFIDPSTNNTTAFCLAGNPVTHSGWYEGSDSSEFSHYGDRYYTMSSGPFNMAAGDTQEVVYAVLMALGNDNLNSLTELKSAAAEIQNNYDSNKPASAAQYRPVDFALSQCYPNPFNPVTSMQYTLGSRQLITIKVFDILGRDIATLVNEEKPAGTYNIQFDASQLSSGVYYYRLIAGSFSETRKMILVK